MTDWQGVNTLLARNTKDEYYSVEGKTTEVNQVLDRDTITWDEMDERPSWWPEIAKLTAEQLDVYEQANPEKFLHPAMRRRWREIVRAIPPGGMIPDTGLHYSLYSWNNTPQPKRQRLAKRCSVVGHDWVDSEMGIICRRCRKWRT